MYKCTTCAFIRSPELCGWKAYTMEEFIQEYGGLSALWKRCMLLLHSNKLHANSLHSSRRILHPKKQSLCDQHSPKVLKAQGSGDKPPVEWDNARHTSSLWQKTGLPVADLNFFVTVFETSLLRTALLSNMKESDKA